MIWSLNLERTIYFDTSDKSQAEYKTFNEHPTLRARSNTSIRKPEWDTSTKMKEPNRNHRYFKEIASN